MNWTGTKAGPEALTTAMLRDPSEDELIDANVTATLFYNNSSSSTAVTTYLNNSSDVLLAVNGLDSLMNVLIAMVLVVLILITAIGTCASFQLGLLA